MSEHRFTTPEPVELRVTIPAGKIAVETVDGDETLITISGDEKLLDQTIVEQRGGAIVVDFHGRRSLFGINISIGDFSLGGGRLDVRASIPHGSSAKLASAAADTKVAGRLLSLDSKTASGDLVVEAEVEREAVVKTVSGDARLVVVGGDLRVQTVSGDVNAGSVGGSLVAKSVSGDVRVDSLREGHAQVQSVSGDIDLGIAPGSAIDVDANSVSGDLSSEVPLAGTPDEIGAGGPTVVVRGKTVSGNFRVHRAA